MWYAPVSDFDVIQGTTASPTTLAERVTIDGDHTFTTGNGFYKCYVTPNTLKMDVESTGSRDSRGAKQMATGFIPGDRAENAGLFRVAKNDAFIVVIKSCDGTVKQIGTQCSPADFVGGFQSGTNEDGEKGWTFNVESYGNGDLFYPGNIVEKV